MNRSVIVLAEGRICVLFTEFDLRGLNGRTLLRILLYMSEFLSVWFAR